MTTGYTVRVRGGSSFVSREYHCPACVETFADTVPNPPPEQIACPACGAAAERTVSAPAVHTQFVVAVSRGKDDAKPHANAMDTRPLAEGMPLSEWKAQRRKIHEADRQRRVKELLS